MIRFIESDYFQSFIAEEVTNEVEYRAKKKQKRRAIGRCSNLWETNWGKTLLNPSTADCETWEGKKFRRRFRIDYRMFRDIIVPLCKDSNVFEMKISSQIPIEFKVLVALRILGRDNDCDTISELSAIGESTCNNIFRKFVVNFAKHFFESYVNFPEGDELKRVMEVYRQLGFPGACGSMDGTHVRWFSCPKHLTNSCKGKESYPSLGWMVVVDHNRRILHCSNSVHGAENDIGIAHNDEFVQKIVNGSLQNLEFYLYNEKGQPILTKGGYLITDGGFLKLPCFIDPDHNNYEVCHLYWSEWLESVRKDIECTFGVLKQRFRFFRSGMNFHSQKVIDGAMKTACILHNMLLVGDGQDRFDWETLNPDAEEDDAEVGVTAFDSFDIHPQEHSGKIQFDTAIVGKCFIAKDTHNYNTFKSLLVQHFTRQYQIGDLHWPRGFNAKSRMNFPKSPAIDRVGETGKLIPVIAGDHFRALYTKSSDLRARDENGHYTRMIGIGLFSSVRLNDKEKLGTFKGDLISAEEYDNRILEGRGGKAIKVTNSIYLDCYQNALSSKCILFKANNGNKCYNISLFESASNNCEIKIISGLITEVNLYTTCKIEANIELCWNYGDNFSM